MKAINFEKEQIELLEELVASATVSEKIKKSILTKLKNAKKTPIKVSSRKAKGRELQYWVCRKIANIFHIEFNQQDDECLIHSREMGQHNVDIVLRGYVKKQFPFSIECKNQETISIKDWIKQAKTNEQENNYWMLIFKNKEIKNPVVCLDFETFLKFYKMQL